MSDISFNSLDLAESERRWDDLFARSLDLLSELADEAVREDEAGLTQALDLGEL